MNEFKEKLRLLLRKLEKYTHTDMVYFVSGNFWLTLKKVILLLISFGLSIAFANLITQDTYGKYKYVFSIFALLSIPTLPGMGQSIMRAVARGYEGTVKKVLKIKILWGTLGSLASFFVAAYYYLNGNTELASSFVIVSIFLPFVDTFGIFSTILTGKKLFRISLFYEIVVQTTYAVIMTATLFYTNDLYIILLSYFLSFTVIRFVVLKVVLKKHTDNQNVDPQAISYGKHLSFMSVLSTAAESIDNVLLWHFMGAPAVAIYAFSKSMPLQIQSMLESTTTIAFPKFAQKELKEIQSTIHRKIFLVWAITVIIVGAYIFTAPFIFKIFFPQYLNAVLYSQVFSLILFFFPKKIIGTIFGAHAHTKKLYVYTITSSIVKIVLTIILIPTYGIMGAVFAELALRAYSLILMGYFLKRSLPNQQ